MSSPSTNLKEREGYIASLGQSHWCICCKWFVSSLLDLHCLFFYERWLQCEHLLHKYPNFLSINCSGTRLVPLPRARLQNILNPTPSNFITAPISHGFFHDAPDNKVRLECPRVSRTSPYSISAWGYDNLLWLYLSRGCQDGSMR